MKGSFPERDLLESSHDGSGVFGEHPPAPGHLPGIEAATGSLRSWTTDRGWNGPCGASEGAGDSMLVSAAMALVVGAPIWEAAYLGSLAAACQVGRIGNVPLKVEELVTEIRL